MNPFVYFICLFILNLFSFEIFLLTTASVHRVKNYKIKSSILRTYVCWKINLVIFVSFLFWFFKLTLYLVFVYYSSPSGAHWGAFVFYLISTLPQERVEVSVSVQLRLVVLLPLPVLDGPHQSHHLVPVLPGGHLHDCSEDGQKMGSTERYQNLTAY